MIQDIAPYKLDNQYDVEAVAQLEDYVLHAIGNEIVVSCGDVPELPRVRDYGECAEISNIRGSGDCSNEESKESLGDNKLEALGAEGSQNCIEGFRFLFRIDDMNFYMPEVAALGAESRGVIPEGFELTGIRAIPGMPKHLRYAVLTGKHLTDWYRDNRFCGRCGHKMVHSRTERAMTCPDCGYTCYPRIMPAVIVACIKGDRILVSRYSKGYKHYALIAGFTEIGETLEETVAREVFEETGINVKNIRYYKTQPWGIANDILVGYVCEADGDDEIVIDKNELSEALWMTADELEVKHDDFALTNELLWKFKCGELYKILR